MGAGVERMALIARIRALELKERKAVESRNYALADRTQKVIEQLKVQLEKLGGGLDDLDDRDADVGAPAPAPAPAGGRAVNARTVMAALVAERADPLDNGPGNHDEDDEDAILQAPMAVHRTTHQEETEEYQGKDFDIENDEEDDDEEEYQAKATPIPSSPIRHSPQRQSYDDENDDDDDDGQEEEHEQWGVRRSGTINTVFCLVYAAFTMLKV
jgi:hypothetical protein